MNGNRALVHPAPGAPPGESPLELVPDEEAGAIAAMTGEGPGMAIKVMNVAKNLSTTQDFIMINNPVFLMQNAPDYAAFQSATNPLRFFLPGWNPFRFRFQELFTALRITRRIVSNSLHSFPWPGLPLAGKCLIRHSKSRLANTSRLRRGTTWMRTARSAAAHRQSISNQGSRACPVS